MASTIQCVCGHRNGIGSFPNDNVSFIVSQERFDALPESATMTDLRRIVATSDLLIECPTCGRLIRVNKDGERFYRDESDAGSPPKGG